MMHQRMGYVFIQKLFPYLAIFRYSLLKRTKKKTISSIWLLITHSCFLWVHLMSEIRDGLHCNFYIDRNQQTNGMLSRKKTAVFNIFLCVPSTQWCRRDAAVLFSAELLFIPALMSFLSPAACLHHRWVKLWQKGVTPSQLTPSWHQGAGRVKIRITKMLTFVFTGLQGKLWKCG